MTENAHVTCTLISPAAIKEEAQNTDGQWLKIFAVRSISIEEYLSMEDGVLDQNNNKCEAAEMTYVVVKQKEHHEDVP